MNGYKPMNSLPTDRQFKEDLAIGFANLKGSKNKDLIGTALALKRLRLRQEFPSNVKVGKLFGVSGEIVREFISLLDLPSDVQAMLKNKQLNLEQGRRLSQLFRHRPELLKLMSESVMGMRTEDLRELVSYFLRFQDIPIEKAKSMILDSRTRKIKEFHVIAIVNEEQYAVLKKLSRGKGLSVDELVTSIITEWMGEQKDE